MSQLRPLYGHTTVATRLARAIRQGTLPAALLYTGPRGVGKQRLALWTAQTLLCEEFVSSDTDAPCGHCQNCRFAIRLQHPDLHWFFPRPRLKDADASPDDVRADLAEAIGERLADDGLWGPSSGTDALYIATIRALVSRATLRPAMARRSVFVIGDAERMVAQEGSDQAANAFLKLLEEPPATTTLILTSSEPGALLPTIRSRVITVRVPPMRQQAVADLIHDEAMQRRFLGASDAELLARSGGTPGVLFAGERRGSGAAFDNARAILEAAFLPGNKGGAAERIQVSAKQGVAGARGSFSDTMEALTLLLHDFVRHSVAAGHDEEARRAAEAIVLVEETRARAQGNVNPQLLGVSLVEGMHKAMYS